MSRYLGKDPSPVCDVDLSFRGWRKGSETSSSRRLEEPTLLLLSLIYPYRSPRGVNRGSRDLSSRFGAEKR